jgi:hypothetical protein
MTELTAATWTQQRRRVTGQCSRSTAAQHPYGPLMSKGGFVSALTTLTTTSHPATGKQHKAPYNFTCLAGLIISPTRPSAGSHGHRRWKSDSSGPFEPMTVLDAGCGAGRMAIEPQRKSSLFHVLHYGLHRRDSHGTCETCPLGRGRRCGNGQSGHQSPRARASPLPTHVFQTLCRTGAVGPVLLIGYLK